jgi:hypothetical protein
VRARKLQGFVDGSVYREVRGEGHHANDSARNAPSQPAPAAPQPLAPEDPFLDDSDNEDDEI